MMRISFLINTAFYKYSNEKIKEKIKSATHLLAKAIVRCINKDIYN